MPSQSDGVPFVDGGIYVRKLFVLQPVAFSGNTAAVIPPDSTGKQPLVSTGDERFIHHDPVGDTPRRRPLWDIGIGLFTDCSPNTAASIIEAARLGISHPKPAQRVYPKVGVIDAT